MWTPHSAWLPVCVTQYVNPTLCLTSCLCNTICEPHTLPSCLCNTICEPHTLPSCLCNTICKPRSNSPDCRILQSLWACRRAARISGSVPRQVTPNQCPCFTICKPHIYCPCFTICKPRSNSPDCRILQSLWACRLAARISESVPRPETPNQCPCFTICGPRSNSPDCRILRSQWACQHGARISGFVPRPETPNQPPVRPPSSTRLENVNLIITGLSISHVRRPGLSKFTSGLAKSALNKSPGLARPYPSNQLSKGKVWPSYQFISTFNDN